MDISAGFAVPAAVITTEPLAVRRRHAGELELDFVPAGTACTVVDADDIDGTWILVTADGDEIWHVSPRQFRIATAPPAE